MNNYKILLSKKKKLSLSLSKLNTMPLSKQIEIYDKLLNIIKVYNKHLSKQNKQIPSTLNKVYENIFDELCNLGPPFVKHRKGTKTHKRSITLIKKHYKKYRYKIIDIFKLGQEYFLDKDFSFKPEGGKIGICDFFKYSKKQLQFNPYLKNWTESWFGEFSKGRGYIEKNFMKKIKTKHPLIIKDFIGMWESKRDVKCNDFDKRHAIILIDRIIELSKLNDVGARTMIGVLERLVEENDYIENIKYLTSDYCVNYLIPKKMVDVGLFRSIRDIKIKGE